MKLKNMNGLSKILIIIIGVVLVLFIGITVFKVFLYDDNKDTEVVEKVKNSLLESLIEKYKVNIKYNENETCLKIEDCNISDVTISNYDNEDSVNLIMSEYDKDFNITSLCPPNSLKCSMAITATSLPYNINFHYLYSFSEKKLLLSKITTDMSELIVNDTLDGNAIVVNDINVYESKYFSIIEDIGGDPVHTNLLYVFDSSFQMLYTYSGINITYNDTGYEYDSYLKNLGDVYNESSETYDPDLTVGYRYKRDYVSPVTFPKKVKLSKITAITSAYK